MARKDDEKARDGTTEKIRRRFAGVSGGDLRRLIMADGRVSTAEARLLLQQMGFEPHEIDEAALLEVMELVEAGIPTGQGLEHLADTLQGKVDKMGKMIEKGTIHGDIQKMSKSDSLAPGESPGMDREKGGKTKEE